MNNILILIIHPLFIPIHPLEDEWVKIDPHSSPFICYALFYRKSLVLLISIPISCKDSLSGKGSVNLPDLELHIVHSFLSFPTSYKSFVNRYACITQWLVYMKT